MKIKLAIFILLILSILSSNAQEFSSSSNNKEIKAPEWVNNLKMSFYLDCYYTYDLGVNYYYTSQALNVRPFASTCPFPNEFRINRAMLRLDYNYDWARATFALQYGDIPLLTAPTDVILIKNIRIATFGIRITKKLWFDAGYLLNPIGAETTSSQDNVLISNSIGAYPEPGSMLGIQFTYSPTEKFNAKFQLVNSYSLVKTTNSNKALGIALSHSITPKINLNYCVQLSNVTDFNGPFILQAYNNAYAIINFGEKWTLIAQMDFENQSKSLIPKDSTKPNNKMGWGLSGMTQLNFAMSKKFVLGGRLEFITDPSNVLMQNAFNETPGMIGIGQAIALSFSPYPKTYIRAEYAYLALNEPLFYFNSRLTHSYRSNISLAFGVNFK